MNVLITGATGFVGREITKKLILNNRYKCAEITIEPEWEKIINAVYHNRFIPGELPDGHGDQPGVARSDAGRLAETRYQLGVQDHQSTQRRHCPGREGRVLAGLGDGVQGGDRVPGRLEIDAGVGDRGRWGCVKGRGHTPAGAPPASGLDQERHGSGAYRPR